MSSSESSRPHVQEFLDKLEEIRAVFLLGRRSLPFLEEVFHFVQDVTVLIEEVDATIQTRTGHMKRATEQLKSVSEATEVATSEILDHTDEVLASLDVLKEGIRTSQEKFDDLAAADERLLDLLRKELGDEHADLLEKVEQVEDEKKAFRQERRAELDDAREALSAIRTRMNQITMSLQVQDITEQQLTSVNHLIETVRTRIDTLLNHLGTGRAAEEEVPSDEPSRTATFNENARYDRSPDRQRSADDLMESLRGEGDAEDSSQNGTREDPPDADTNGASSSPSEAASQEDIDQMFGAPADEEDTAPDANEEGDEVASQEDIDELFE